MDPEIRERAVRSWGRTAFAFDVLEAPERYLYFASERVPGAFVPYREVGRVVYRGVPLVYFELILPPRGK